MSALTSTLPLLTAEVSLTSQAQRMEIVNDT